ncbi:hypothetical protein C8R44DRAFT_749438 [Mycena epipterygia]|nr:hypothetical protein C8R44DRAFT_749438 [Mycena epipterygia]
MAVILDALFIVEVFHFQNYHPIATPEQLIAQAICHFGKFNDLLLESKFYSTFGEYSFFKGNISRANQFLDKALVLAKSCGNKKQQASVLNCLAFTSWNIGDYHAAQIHARGTQRLAQLSADLYEECQALQIEAIASVQAVHQNLDKARQVFTAAGDTRVFLHYEISSGELHLREKETHRAKLIFQKGFNSARQNNNQTALSCLESLANTGWWPACDFEWASRWTVVYLVYVKGKKDKRALHKALQFLGDIFLTEGDLNTAGSLFTVALETFTYMNIHRSRAECMLRLGDISEQRGHLVEAVKLWKEAQPLFERSLQTKEITQIDTRLAAVDQEILDRNGKTPALPIPSSE